MTWLATTTALSIIGLFAAGVSGAIGPGSTGCVDDTIDAMQRRYESISDLRADFVQTTRTVALSGSAQDETARGTVVFAKPAKMRWSYTEPEPSLTVSDGETLWLYDPARAEVQRMTGISSYFSGAAVQFLIGKGDVRRDFEVAELACTADYGELELRPREDSSFEKLVVRVDRETGELRRSVIVDLVGNRTEVEFSNVVANQAPDDGVFRFTPPKGVEVIDLNAR